MVLITEDKKEKVAVFRKILLISNVISIVVFVFFGILLEKKILVIVILPMTVLFLIGLYFISTTNSVSVYRIGSRLLFRNEYNFFKKGDKEIPLDRCSKVIYQFNDAPRHGSDSLCFLIDKKRIVVLINFSDEDLKHLIRVFVDMNIPFSCSKIQNGWQRETAKEWMKYYHKLISTHNSLK